MPPSEFLRRLVQQGALVHDQQSDTLTIPGHAEVLGSGAVRQFYWVAADGEDQHHSHARKFDAVEVVDGRALVYSLRGLRVLYVAPFADWSQYRADDLSKTLADCRRVQENSAEARTRWQRLSPVVARLWGSIAARSDERCDAPAPYGGG